MCCVPDGIATEASDLVIRGYADGFSCYGFNLTLADWQNGTVIEGVTIDIWDGSTLRSFVIGKSSAFSHLKRIQLAEIPVTELTAKDIMDFHDLQTLIVFDTPITFMENGLLCYSLNITMLYYKNSLGSLTVFPRQIFNCTFPLKLEFLRFQNHNIASLPAHAFGSAAEQLRVLQLVNIGLEVIQKDAFTGVLNLQYVNIHENNLLHILGAMLPPSTRLQLISYRDYKLNRNLNLTKMKIARRRHLQMFECIVRHLSLIDGSFCSQESNSELEIILLEGIKSDQSHAELEHRHSESNTSKTETLPANVFAHCITLKYLSIKHTGLAYLPHRLFYTNAFQLETLSLVGNKLNSNTSWSDVLLPLHELKKLNLSGNMLTSWTYSLNSLWSLELLDLSHNAITEISHVAFMNMTRLKFLSLENNNLIVLAPKVQHAFTNIPMLNLGSNNLCQINISSETMLSDTITTDMSANNLRYLDLPSKRKCSSPCGKISLFVDYNKLSRFVLPCSHTHQYATVSLTNTKLTDINSVLPNVLVQQCSIENLNVSGNEIKAWNTEKVIPFQYYVDRCAQRENRTHNITILDMTHCKLTVINPLALEMFTIQFLDLRGNALHSIPIMDERLKCPNIHVFDFRFNQLTCSCKMYWWKPFIQKQTPEGERVILADYCMEPVWNTSMDIFTAPDIMFLCNKKCPQQIHEQCDEADRCYTTHHDLDAAVCLSSHNSNKLSSAFITVLHQLHISGFNLSTLQLPYAKPHSLMHLNLTSCNIRVIPETTFINTPRLELLVLAYNAIKAIPTATFHPLVWLKYLDLSNNQLQSFDADMIFPLFHLDTVLLHDNNMKQLSRETLEEFKILTNLSLHNNPWICKCNDTFGHWIVEQQTLSILLSPKNITCGGTDIPVMFSNVTCTIHTKVHVVHPGSKAAILIPSVLASVLAVTLIVCILIYKYRLTLSVLVFIYMPRCTRKRTENDDVRGVFAICDDKEMGARVWIKDSLLPFIECACPLLWSERTFIIGQDMADNIQDAVEKSNCAIILLSRRFLQNEWSCCMFQAAFSEVRERKRPYKIILILTPDVTVNMLTSDENCPQDLRVMLKTQRLVYMSKKFYHETLLYMLPDSCRSTRQIMAIRGEGNITTFYEQQS